MEFSTLWLTSVGFNFRELLENPLTCPRMGVTSVVPSLSGRVLRFPHTSLRFPHTSMLHDWIPSSSSTSLRAVFSGVPSPLSANPPGKLKSVYVCVCYGINGCGLYSGTTHWDQPFCPRVVLFLEVKKYIMNSPFCPLLGGSLIRSSTVRNELNGVCLS